MGQMFKKCLDINHSDSSFGNRGTPGTEGGIPSITPIACVGLVDLGIALLGSDITIGAEFLLSEDLAIKGSVVFRELLYEVIRLSHCGSLASDEGDVVKIVRREIEGVRNEDVREAPNGLLEGSLLLKF